MSCLDDNTLFELSLGQLTDEALQTAEQHVDRCARCRRALAETLRTSGPRPPKPPPLVATGTSVGRYIVIERVGAGAVGQVFSAYDPQLDRKVALKLLRPGSSTEEHRARLGREAQTLARLSHPNVVTVFDVGTWEGQLFIALEFVSGGSARKWLAASPRAWREILTLYAQAGRGLAAAHRAGVIHRDFKPDNVLVRADGGAQVTDFGLSAAESSPGEARGPTDLGLTQSDALLGTPAYMAADQLEGATATLASDQFSFCAALFEALSGERPFEGKTVAELVRNLRDGQVKTLNTEAPAKVKRVLLRGLSADPKARFPSMDALVDALEAAGARSRSLWLLTTGGAALLTLAVGAFYSSTPIRRQPTCALAEARQLATWNESRQTSLEGAFLATGLSHARDAVKRVDEAVRARSDSWRPLRAEACEAVLRARSTPFFEAQLQCLDERFAELEATLRVLTAGGPEAVNKAVPIIEKVPGPSACSRPAPLAHWGVDAGPCEACVSDRAVVAKAQALFEQGKFDEAGQVVALGLDGGATTASALASLAFERGRVLEEQGKLDDAEEAFFQSGLAAQRAADGVLGAASWAELGYLTGYLRRRWDEGERWVAQAEVLCELRPDCHLAERLLSVRGVIAARRGRLPEAERFFAQVENLVRSQRGAAHPLRARALSNLGSSQLHQGRVDEALPKLEEAWRLLSAALGEEHPDTFQALNSYGAALGNAKRFEAAIPVFERAYSGYKKTLGAAHPRIGTAALNLAEAERRVGRLNEALAHFAEAAAIWEKSGDSGRSLALASQGGILLEQKKLGEALLVLEKGVAVCGHQACDPIDEGQARGLFARALKAAGRPQPQVRAEVKRALELLEPLGEETADQVEELKRLLR